MSQSVKDFFAGLCSGWAQVMIMQPFDIIKIRLQTQDLAKPRYSGIGDCFKKIVAEEGPLALYKGNTTVDEGTLSPLIGCGFQVSIQFGLNEKVKRYFSSYKEKPSDPLPMKFVALSGIIAGIGCAIVSVIAPLMFRHLCNMQGYAYKFRIRTIRCTRGPCKQPRRSLSRTASRVCSVGWFPPC